MSADNRHSVRWGLDRATQYHLCSEDRPAKLFLIHPGEIMFANLYPGDDPWPIGQLSLSALPLGPFGAEGPLGWRLQFNAEGILWHRDHDNFEAALHAYVTYEPPAWIVERGAPLLSGGWPE